MEVVESSRHQNRQNLVKVSCYVKEPKAECQSQAQLGPHFFQQGRVYNHTFKCLSNHTNHIHPISTTNPITLPFCRIAIFTFKAFYTD